MKRYLQKILFNHQYTTIYVISRLRHNRQRYRFKMYYQDTGSRVFPTCLQDDWDITLIVVKLLMNIGKNMQSMVIAITLERANFIMTIL